MLGACGPRPRPNRPPLARCTPIGAPPARAPVRFREQGSVMGAECTMVRVRIQYNPGGRCVLLTRQKVLLALLEQVGHPLSATVFVKLVFLLRQETGLQDDNTFYDFVPYRYGPFSFALYRELSSLRNQGYVVPGEERITLASGTWELTRRAIADLPAATCRAVATVAAGYGTKSQNSLLREVYAKYPWYAKRQRIRWTSAGQPSQSFYGRDCGIHHGIRGQVGRPLLRRPAAGRVFEPSWMCAANPVSRKYGFAKRSLQEISPKLGLDYFTPAGVGYSRRPAHGVNEPSRL